jgi:ubiquinone biosynthesis protein
MASRVLRDRFSRREVRQIVSDALHDYDCQRSSPLREGKMPLVVRFGALTIGFYRALMARGVEEAEARRLTSQVTWLAYEKVSAIPWVLAASTTRDPLRRLERATSLYRRFPFRAPSYDIIDVPAEKGVVAVDVRRCPIAEYFQAKGLAPLCVDAWCNLDFPLARRWGARLERTGTLAQGAERCDFRWRVEQKRQEGRTLSGVVPRLSIPPDTRGGPSGPPGAAR